MLKISIEHHHYFHSSDDVTHRLLHQVLKNQEKMDQNLQDIKDQLTAADAKATKIAADVTALHTKIDSIRASGPSTEEWAEVKQMATDLNNKLQGIDDQTAEEVTEGGEITEGPTP